MTDRRFACRLAAIVLTLVVYLPGALVASPGPENVLVVVNRESWASQAVANHFIKLRNIPATHVVHLQLGELSSFEIVSVETFREKILKPVLQQVGERGLTGQVDCIAWSADLPYAVNFRDDLPEKLRKNKMMKFSQGSINGLTYLYGLVLRKDHRYSQLGTNFYYRRTAAAVPRADFDAADRGRLGQALQLMKEKKYDLAQKVLVDLAKKHPKAATVHYNLACCFALQEKPELAMESLTAAVKQGWSDKRHTLRDTDLASLREREDFKKLVASMKADLVAPQPPVPFRQATAWSQAGQPVKPGQGMQYMLSTMLGVTSGRGNSLQEIVSVLERGVAADGTMPRGTIYFMINSDIRSRTRQPIFASAVSALNEAGVSAEAIDGKLPLGRDNCMGVMAGSAGFDWSKSDSTILPGAIAEHLTSFGGVMHQFSGQTPISAFVRAGASGTSGTVIEPYAIRAKFPSPFVHYFYARGATLVEAFYMSVAGPYQLLILGDPLVRPWAPVPKLQLVGLRDGHVVKDTVEIRGRIVDADKVKLDRLELYVDGKLTTAAPATQPLKFDTTRTDDGCHAVRVVAVLDNPMASRSGVSMDVMVDNTGGAVQTRPRVPGKVRLDETVTVPVSVPGATALELEYQGRVVARVDGARGRLQVPAATLGLGPVRVQAVAVRGAGDESARTRLWPVDLEVQLPEQLRASRVKDDQLTDGLALTVGDDKPKHIKFVRTRRKWGTDDIVAGKPFKLEGYVVAGRDGLHQVQVFYGGPLTVTVDGVKVKHGDGRAWTSVPLNLEKGLHAVTIEGEGVKGSKLDVRFGHAGARSLSGKTIRVETDRIN